MMQALRRFWLLDTRRYCFDQVEHTMAERKVMETISHPFLMKLHYAFQVGSGQASKGEACLYIHSAHTRQNSTRLYFVMDYLPGGELFFHLRKFVLRWSSQLTRYHHLPVRRSFAAGNEDLKWIEPAFTPAKSHWGEHFSDVCSLLGK